ncbi:MAG: PEP-CTERM sorting domain-containing protein [Planctomycetes bacterium]|nr:PEP-CTERM sorting domain-containing protein [Planctomycetota bacterium]
MQASKLQIVMGAVVALAAASANAAVLINNPDFELSPDLDGWTETRPAGTSDTMYLEKGTAGGDGTTYLDNTASGSHAFDIPAVDSPTKHKFVVSDAETSGSNVLYQVFTLPSGSFSSLTIDFDYFARNHYGSNVVGAGGLDNSSIGSQFARVDILKSTVANGGIFALSGANVILRPDGNPLYSSFTENDVNTNGGGEPDLVNWQHMTVTLKGYFSGSYVFRIAEVDSFRPFQFGVDNVTISEIPEPASITLLSLGGLLMFRRRRA